MKLIDLKAGDKFKVIGNPIPRVYIYKSHVSVKTVLFDEQNGNGKLTLPESALFKINVEVVL